MTNKENIMEAFVTVADMIEALRALPADARLVVTESGYYSYSELARVCLPEAYTVESDEAVSAGRHCCLSSRSFASVVLKGGGMAQLVFSTINSGYSSTQAYHGLSAGVCRLQDSEAERDIQDV